MIPLQTSVRTAGFRALALLVMASGVAARAATADLSNLELNRGFFTLPIPLTPSFNSNTFNYTAAVSNEVWVVAVRPTSTDSLATNEVRVNGGIFTTIASGKLTGHFPIRVGTNTLEVRVTATNGTSSNSYYVSLLRAAGKPSVATEPAAASGTASAELAGAVNPNGSPTIVFFEWGTSTNYSTTTMPSAGGTGDHSTHFSHPLTNLSPNTTYHFRAVASNSAGVSYGADRSFALRFEDLNASLPGVYRGAAAWGDYDNDGRLDMVLTGYASNGPIADVWRNTGSGFTNINAGLPGVSHGAVAWGDYDNDERLDILLSGFAGYDSNDRAKAVCGIWRNTGSGFTPINTPFPPLKDGAVAWGDYDNDGRLDVVIAGEPVNGYFGSPLTQLWRNTGSGFELAPAGFAGVKRGAVAWGDYDNDGRLDLLLTGHGTNGPIAQLWRNTAGGFVSVACPLPAVQRGSLGWGDYDADGRLDILVSGQDADVNRHCEVWRNTGGGFTNINAGLTGVSQGTASWGDYDNDGRLDILLSGSIDAHPSYSAVTEIWRNVGTGFSNLHAGLPGVSQGIAAWGDCDNDGKLDVLLAPARPASFSAATTRTIHVAYRTDGIDGVGTAEDPRDGSNPAVVHSVLHFMNGLRVVFGEGTFPLTNTVAYEDNNTVIGAGWGRTILELATNVTAATEMVAFYPATEDCTNNVFHGFTIDMRGHLNAGYTNSIMGLSCLGSGNLLEIEVRNAMGNWLGNNECFPIFVWPARTPAWTNIGRNVIRSRVIATNTDYPRDYITAITIGGRRPDAVGQEYDLIEDSVVLGRSPNNLNGAFSVFGRAALRDSVARFAGNGVYHETQSGGADDGDNGKNLIWGNDFEQVTHGVFMRGFLTNRTFEISQNRITSVQSGIQALADNEGLISNFVAAGNLMLPAAGTPSDARGLALFRILNGRVAHNVVADALTNNYILAATNLTVLSNLTVAGSPLFSGFAPATNSPQLAPRGGMPMTSYESNNAGSQIWRNLSPATNAPPAAPSGLVTAINASRASLSWQSPGTNWGAISYSLRVGTTPTGSDLLSAHAGMNGFRRLPGLGNMQNRTAFEFSPPVNQTIYWSVQSVDAAWTGSPFSEPPGFRITAATNAVPGDLDGNGIVDATEFGVVVSNFWFTSSPTVSSVALPSGTAFQFALTNLSSLNLGVEVSNDLTNWQSLGIAPLFYSISDPDATNHTQRFYRPVLP